MKISMIFLLLVSSVSFAGGSVVRNGGGLGEMAAVMIFEKMQLYLSFCLQNTKSCGLTEKENAIIKKVYLDLPAEYQAYQLQFFSETLGPDVVTENKVGSPIAIRSGALADSSGVPYSFSKIGSLVLSGLLAHQGMSSMDLAQKIFLPVKSEDTSFFVDTDTNIIHWFRIATQGNTDSLDEIILEQRDRSFDLFQLIQTDSKLCSDSNNLKMRIQRMFSPNPMSKTVILDVNWNCGGEHDGTAKIELELSFSDSGAFQLSSSHASAFSVLHP